MEMNDECVLLLTDKKKRIQFKGRIGLFYSEYVWMLMVMDDDTGFNAYLCVFKFFF